MGGATPMHGVEGGGYTRRFFHPFHRVKQEKASVSLVFGSKYRLAKRQRYLVVIKERQKGLMTSADP